MTCLFSGHLDIDPEGLLVAMTDNFAILDTIFAVFEQVGAR